MADFASSLQDFQEPARNSQNVIMQFTKSNAFGLILSIKLLLDSNFLWNQIDWRSDSHKQNACHRRKSNWCHLRGHNNCVSGRGDNVRIENNTYTAVVWKIYRRDIIDWWHQYDEEFVPSTSNQRVASVSMESHTTNSNQQPAPSELDSQAWFNY